MLSFSQFWQKVKKLENQRSDATVAEKKTINQTLKMEKVEINMQGL